jgi:NAD(P)-dependent dehydrogenase (short-subunit alcohol dehydrogenase family)
MPETWTFDDMPDQTGRTVVVTGASSGLGLIAADQMAAHGATVLMAVRDVAKGTRVAATFRGDVEVHHLDLADLESVRRFAADLHAAGRHIDVLLNNAGIGARQRLLTPQGQESVFATNHLGHFALTGLLLDLFRPDHDPRVVTVSSNLYRRTRTRIDFDDLTAARSFAPGRAYIRSKLANMLFGAELDRRLRATGSGVRSFLTHPGMALTPMNAEPQSAGEKAVMAIAKPLLARTAEQGTLPLLFAATSPHAKTGVFLGPGLRRSDLRVHFAEIAAPATDRELAARLWAVSQDLTGVTYLDRADLAGDRATTL